MIAPYTFCKCYQNKEKKKEKTDVQSGCEQQFVLFFYRKKHIQHEIDGPRHFDWTYSSYCMSQTYIFGIAYVFLLVSNSKICPTSTCSTHFCDTVIGFEIWGTSTLANIKGVDSLWHFFSLIHVRTRISRVVNHSLSYALHVELRAVELRYVAE